MKNNSLKETDTELIKRIQDESLEQLTNGIIGKK